MTNYNRNHFLFVILCLFNAVITLAQKPDPDGTRQADKPCEPAKDYAIIKKGETKCLTEQTMLTYLTLEGGTLIISGNARINNLAINKGQIIITNTASAILPSMIFNGNVSLINRGSVTYTGNVTMINGNNQIVNETPESKMNWGNSELNLGGRQSSFVNNGSVVLGTLRLDSKSGKTVLGPNAALHVVNLANNYSNSIFVPNGIATLTQSGYAQLSKPLTSHPGLRICLGSNAKLPVPTGTSTYGSATMLDKNCNETSKH